MDKKEYGGQARPNEVLEREIMNSSFAKNDREWWAKREIEKLREQLANLQEQPREEYVENSLKEQVKKNIKEMSKQCFGYEPSDDVLERTTMEVFFSLSPLLGNKNKGLSCPQEQPKERKEE